jgi:predicted Zn-dependent protease
VYSYAGGPGLRTGDTADIGRLFTAGLYEQALVDRARHQPAAAAGLIDELARRSPGDTGVELLRIESLLRDREDAAGALAALSRLRLPSDNPRLQVRAGLLTADAYVASGQADSARAVLRRLVTQFPMSQRLKDRLAQLGG